MCRAHDHDTRESVLELLAACFRKAFLFSGVSQRVIPSRFVASGTQRINVGKTPLDGRSRVAEASDRHAGGQKTVLAQAGFWSVVDTKNRGRHQCGNIKRFNGQRSLKCRKRLYNVFLYSGRLRLASSTCLKV